MTEAETGECRHFLSYTGVKLPLALLNELQPGQLENRIAYFAGHFDGQDRLIRVQKVVYGEIEMEHRYAYDAEGALRRAEIVDADGETTVLSFDAAGNPSESD